MEKFKQFKPRSGPPRLKEFSICKECWKQENAKDKSSDSTTTGALFDQLSAVWSGTDPEAVEQPHYESVRSIISRCDELFLERESAIASTKQLLASSTLLAASIVSQEHFIAIKNTFLMFITLKMKI